jgi:hypothetical protein
MHTLSIELTIKILTIIGSILGSIAFFQNITKEVTNTNKEKWKKITEIIIRTDYDNLQYQISGRKIQCKTIDKMQIYYTIDKNDPDIVGFKSIFKNKFTPKLIQLNTRYEQLRKLVQVPFWVPHEETDDDINVTDVYLFNKDVFFKDENRNWTNDDYQKATSAYANHLEQAESIAKEMEKIFVEIQVLANKDPYELLLPWKWFQG